MAGLAILEVVAIQMLMILCVETSKALHLPVLKLALFFGARNQGLQSAKYMDMEVNSFAICVRDCLLDSQCQSVNYLGCSRMCELNEVTRIERPDDFKEMQGNIYFDRHKDTLLLSLCDDITCKTLHEAGAKTSGIYTLTVAQRQVQAYCDMTSDDGGWVLFQRRQDGSVDFYRNWTEYQAGFGKLSGEFWLGNDVIRDLTELSCPWKPHIDLEDWDNSTVWAEYDNFRLEGDLYTLRIGAYKGTAGDSLDHNNGWAFSTKDQDHDYPGWNCAQAYRGGWWYFWCHEGNLNGEYQHTRGAERFYGITWKGWRGEFVSLKKCRMKMREGV